LARGNGNGGTRQAQNLSQEFDHGGVGAAIDGRGGERELQGITERAGDGVFLGARMDADGEGEAAGGLVDGDQLLAPCF